MAKIVALENYSKEQLISLVKGQSSCLASVREQQNKLEVESARLIASIDTLKEILFTRYPSELVAGEFNDL